MKTEGMQSVPPLGLFIIKAGLVGSHAEYPRASNVLRVPPDGKDEASGSLCMRSCPRKDSRGKPFSSAVTNAVCFSAVSSVRG